MHASVHKLVVEAHVLAKQCVQPTSSTVAPGAGAPAVGPDPCRQAGHKLSRRRPTRTRHDPYVTVTKRHQVSHLNPTNPGIAISETHATLAG